MDGKNLSRNDKYVRDLRVGVNEDHLVRVVNDAGFIKVGNIVSILNLINVGSGKTMAEYVDMISNRKGCWEVMFIDECDHLMISEIMNVVVAVTYADNIYEAQHKSNSHYFEQ